METRLIPIQKKLMRMVMLICGTVLLLISTAFFVYEFISYREIAKDELHTMGRLIASNATSSLAFYDQNDARELLGALKAQKEVVAACLYDKGGKIFSTYPANFSPAELPSLPGKAGYSLRANVMEGFEPVVQGSEQLGTLYLRTTSKAIYQRFYLYVLIAGCFIALSFLFTYLLSKQMQRAISQPILQLAQTAKAISTQKDYSVRVGGKTTHDEIGELKLAFNQMLSQIQEQNNQILDLNNNLEERILQRIEELRKLNTELTRQNEFIQTIIDASIDSIAVFDEHMHYVAINRQAVENFRSTKEAILNRHILEVFPQMKDKPFMQHLQKALDGTFQHISPYQSQMSDHFFENFFIPLKNKTGTVDRVLLIGHDITDIMQTNEKLKQVNADLEKSNRDLEQFAYVASHDLQEPLRKIRTFSELSRQNAGKPEILNRYLGKISSSAERMSELIQAVLNYSRLSPNENEMVPVSLQQVVEQIKDDLELIIEEKGATIEVGTLPPVKAIPLQMHQLFLNLMTNALKFTDKKPQISINALVIPQKERAEKSITHSASHWLKIDISDNGIGFDQKYAAQLFSIFKRLHAADAYAGTGIGLALCKKIVENHKGSISVKSELGKGTTFTIYLPYDFIAQHKPTPGTEIPLADVNPKRVS